MSTESTVRTAVVLASATAAAAQEEAPPSAEGVRARLLAAARTAFLADGFAAVSTRLIAERAQANVSMIRYYFGSKAGLFEEMVRDTLAPLLDALDGPMLDSADGLRDYLRLYYATMVERPEFPRLILKVLALDGAPGRQFVQQLLARGRSRATRRVRDLQARGEASPDINADVLRLTFVSLAMTPMLLRGIVEEQLERPLDAEFLDALATLNARLLAGAFLDAGPANG